MGYVPFLSRGRAQGRWETFQGDPERTGEVDRPAIGKPAVRWKTQIGICGYLNNAVVAEGKVSPTHALVCEHPRQGG